MKRILSLLIATTIIFSSFVVSFANEDVEVADNTPKYSVKMYKEAEALINRLLGEAVFPAAPEQAVTRAEFVKATASLFNVHTKDGATVYSDVSENHSCAAAINAAYDLKWISAADNFYPDEAITYAQALKILLSAADYTALAEAKGGFPVGYLTVADKIDLLDNVSIEENKEVSIADASILFYNILLAPVFEVVSVGESLGYKTKEITYLEKAYEAYPIKGILTATEYNSIVLDAPFVKDNGKVAIDGIEYFYTGLEPSMLGKSVVAYCSDSEESKKELLFILPDKNTELNISAESFDRIYNNTVEYYEEDKRIRADLDSAYKVIYNGRRVAALESDMLSGVSTTIRLLSNNGDEEYEYIFVDTYTYGIVTSIDYFEGYVAFKTPSELLDFTDDKECVVNIYDEKGIKKEIFELEKNNAIAIKASKDNRIYDLIILSDAATGTVSSIAADALEIEIDATGYKVSEDFAASYLKTGIVSAGDRISASVGIYGELACLVSSSVETQYAILHAIDKAAGLKSEARLKIITTNCNFDILELAEKTVVDGSRLNIDEAYTYIKEKFDKSKADVTDPVLVIKYSKNADNLITMVDFASTDTSNFDSIQDSQNSLTRYITNTALGFRNIGFPSKVILSNSTILTLPKDVSKRDELENYTVGTYSMLSPNIGQYTVDVYDINETGNAAFVVVYLADAELNKAAGYTKSYMIEKVTKAIVDEEIGVKLQCWYDNSFVTLFMPEDVPVRKKSGSNKLVPGDIVRFTVLDNKVLKVYVDYDFSTGAISNDDSGGASFDATNQMHYLSFLAGKVYNVSSNSILISNNKDAEGNYSFNYEDLNIYALNDRIACFYSATGTIRSIKVSDIRTYKGYGQEADTVFLRSDYGYPRAAFIIR